MFLFLVLGFFSVDDFYTFFLISCVVYFIFLEEFIKMGERVYVVCSRRNGFFLFDDYVSFWVKFWDVRGSYLVGCVFN